MRIGWPLLPEHFVAPVALHSALMVCGFFGFGIALERAAALKQPDRLRRAGVGGLRHGRGAGAAAGLAGIFWLLAALALVAVYAEVLRRAPELHTAVEAAGARSPGPAERCGGCWRALLGGGGVVGGSSWC